ncbi:hypothetical protein Poli38472_011040 [Pythium oligandrum]|uniref:Uncharacterized protein n=1 Tax=Pythium oligandrum TaxID=41045 RepID=A0A8K1CQ17_PYTOL|nr:hypothetical protein Poli38472_011040 [Pythium oligandrum]|eukprot:TMW67420.1 hypothetical protein Poli38472_011040 [Pythium oligandrum]
MSGYAAILARLAPQELHAHSQEALQIELNALSGQLRAAMAALEQIQHVQQAATQLVGSQASTKRFEELWTLQAALKSKLKQMRANMKDVPTSIPPEPISTKRPRPLLRTSRRKATKTKQEKKQKVEPRVPTVEAAVIHILSDDENGDSASDQSPVDFAELTNLTDFASKLAAQVGTLEVDARRSADVTELVKSVSGLLKRLSRCSEEDMSNRRMRSIFAKIRVAVAVVVSALTAQGASVENARQIALIARAVDQAALKHDLLQRQLASYRDVLGDLEASLLRVKL